MMMDIQIDNVTPNELRELVRDAHALLAIQQRILNHGDDHLIKEEDERFRQLLAKTQTIESRNK